MSRRIYHYQRIPRLFWWTRAVSFGKKSTDMQIWEPFHRGFSFAEECAGVNAVSLALTLHRPAWTLPEQNYCTLLSQFSLYAIPPSDALPMGIAINTTTTQPPDWPLATLQQMSQRIVLEKRQGPFAPQPEGAPIELTRRQKMVLLRIARGLTDQAIAVELHISLDTVRFHKKRLYHLLDTGNAVTAVIRALREGLLSLDEI